MDRTTKFLLAAIAVGLWANAIAAFVHVAKADNDYGYSIDSHLDTIDTNIGKIQRGTCSNNKLCGY